MSGFQKVIFSLNEIESGSSGLGVKGRNCHE